MQVKPPTPCSMAEEWVMLARRPDPDTCDVKWPICDYVYVRDGRMASTDGFRVHMCATDWLDGVYDRDTWMTTTVAENAFKVIDDLMPDYDPSHLIAHAMIPGSLEFREVADGVTPVVYNWGDVLVNQHFWADAVESSTDCKVMLLQGKRAPLVGVNNFGTFMILPIEG